MNQHADERGGLMGDAELSAPDGLAVDALVAAGFELADVPEGLRPRAERALRLLDGLGAGPRAAGGSAELMTAAIVARIARAALGAGEGDGTSVSGGAEGPAQARRGGWVSVESELSPDDAEAMEALVGAGYDARRTPSAVRARAEQVSGLLSLLARPLHEELESDGEGSLGRGPTVAERREALVRRTLDAVQTEADRQAVRMIVDTPRPARSRFRLGELAAAAAVLLVGGAVAAPMITNMRQQNRLAACASNMYAAGVGLGTYANDSRDSLPMASASLAGRPWWNVGSVEESNSANLFTLARMQYVPTMEPLSCPGCATAPRGKPQAGAWDWANLDQVSVSFQNLFSHQRPGWTSPQRMVVLADRSPITLSSYRKEAQNPFANSPNHCGRGQWALCNDGSAEWLKTPLTASGDNIWLPRVLELGLQAADLAQKTGKPVILIGTEAPGAAGDVFLGP